MRIAIGCDHGGFILKAAVVDKLKELGHEVVDFGTNSDASVDYPIYGEAVANAVASKDCDLGVLLCGTGIGISIAANKVKGIRAAVVTDEFMAEMTRRHNNANIIAMGARVVGTELGKMIVDAFFGASFEGGRHERRVNMLTDIEKKYSKEQGADVK